MAVELRQAITRTLEMLRLLNVRCRAAKMSPKVLHSIASAAVALLPASS